MPQQSPRFTESATTALRGAEEEAREANHSAVGDEHLALALARPGDCLAARVLGALGVDHERLRATIATMAPRTVVPPPAAALPRTPRLDEALRLAADEAEGFEHVAVGTDHLLLGILRERAGLGHAALDLLGVTLNKARHETLELRADGASET